jgi:mono/diheme cytochrome c family protein
MFRILIVFSVILLGVLSCYYDSQEYLYPNIGACDTLNVTYNRSVQSIFTNYCTTCHSGSAPDGGVSLTDYDHAIKAVPDDVLRNAVFGTNGKQQMPPNSSLDSCSQATIRIWLDGGALNN